MNLVNLKIENIRNEYIKMHKMGVAFTFYTSRLVALFYILTTFSNILSIICCSPGVRFI